MTDWTPLHGGEAFPAQPGRVRSYGVGVTQTGDLIEEQVTLLRRLAEEDSWYTEAADAFREKAEDLAGKIDKARNRYQETGAALVTFADTVSDLESDAVVRRDRARELERTIAANPHVDEPTGEDEDGEPKELTPAQQNQNRARADAVADLATVQREFDDLVADAEQAARDCASTIEGAIDDDVEDDWWDRNADWLKDVTMVLGWIAFVAVVIALTVVTGGTIWLVVAAVATGLSLVVNLALALEADGGWTAVAIDAFSLATLGMGGLFARGLSQGLASARPAVAALQGSRAYAAVVGRGLGIPRAMYSFLSRARVPVPFGRGLSIPTPLSRLGDRGLATMVRQAGAADDAARAAVMANSPANLTQRVLLNGDSVARELLTVRRLLSEIPRGTEEAAALLAAQRQGLASVASNLAGTGSDAVTRLFDVRHPLEVIGGPVVDLVTDVVD